MWSSKKSKTLALGGVCVVLVLVWRGVASLAALWVRLLVYSGGLVVYLYDTHEAETLGCNRYISLTDTLGSN
jgi:hypothetical protein